MERSSDFAEPVIETLRNRGWCFSDGEQVRILITISSALVGDEDTSKIADSVEAELLNMDIRSIGAKSLPDPTQLKKSSWLQGPKVLQITSVRDISRSSIEEFSGNSGSRRLLKLTLTDGQSEITALEYSHIPSFPLDVVPGTKMRLEKKAAIKSGILCLIPEVVTVLGGVVQSLYEEWQMKKKYSTFSRSSARLVHESDTGGPPRFEKLQVGMVAQQSAYQGKPSYSGFISNVSVPTASETVGSGEASQAGRQHNIHLKADNINCDTRTYSAKEQTEEKPSSSETRVKEVTESVPVQNQAAAQKLLQKMNQPSQDGQHFRGRRLRGKGKEEEPAIFTLDEWEKRKAGAVPVKKNALPDTSHDEDLAWQLQNQLDLEDSHVQRIHGTEVENIKMSMFN